MPGVISCHKVHAVSHFGMQEKHNRLPLYFRSLGEPGQNFLHIVAVVYDNRFPSERSPFGGQISQTGDIVDVTVYLLAVPVGDGDEIVYLVMRTEQGRLPHLTFFLLSVAQKAVNAGVIPVEFLGEGHTRRAGQPLSEGT